MQLRFKESVRLVLETRIEKSRLLEFLRQATGNIVRMYVKPFGGQSNAQIERIAARKNSLHEQIINEIVNTSLISGIDLICLKRFGRSGYIYVLDANDLTLTVIKAT